MLDFIINFRNGFGIDLALLPKQRGIGYINDEWTCIEVHHFRISLPLLEILIGSIYELEGEVTEEMKRWVDDN
tara:strand:- start:446 stop:664 length:219 start_codon:yes stop_codon:yes gene_type:complete